MKTITVCTESTGNTEAMYVDGVLVAQEETIYACEIADSANGRPVILNWMSVDNLSGEWPEKLDEVET